MASRTGVFTENTQNRFSHLKNPYAEFAKVSEDFFTNKTSLTRVNQITEGVYYPAFSYVVGQGLRRKVRMHYVSVSVILEPEDKDDGAEGTEVVLGSASNKTAQQFPVYVLKIELGKQHAILLCEALDPADFRDDFPHGKAFTKADAPF